MLFFFVLLKADCFFVNDSSYTFLQSIFTFYYIFATLYSSSTLLPSFFTVLF